ncbi:MAG: hypothetical protein IKA76_01300 [Clostridia bacterium]|nr:hypothetical protein [Clostridia bacterium]
MKKIGFVDYYLAELHAKNYPAWIAEATEKLSLDYKVCYAWAEQEESLAYPGETSRAWCEQNGVEQCATLGELCEKSDVIIVLAPTNPEKHLGYAETVLKYGKPTYIDKTFAPDLATAKKIFAIAEAYGTPFFSSSALRYSSELDSFENCRQIMVTGSGSNIEEYIIHEIEMVVKKLGLGAEKIKAERFGAQTYLHIAYGDDRSATMMFARSVPYMLYMASSDPKGPRPVTVTVGSEFFKGLIADMLRFFEEKTVSFDTAQTLEVMRIREGAILAGEQEGKWIELSK